MPRHAPRLHARLLLSSEATRGACTVLELRGEPGATIPPHRRAHQDVAALIVAGQVAVRSGEETRKLGPGELAWLPRGDACRLDLLTDGHLLCLAMPSGFEDLVPLLTAGHPIDPDDAAVLLGLAGVSVLPAGWGAPRREAI